MASNTKDARQWSLRETFFNSDRASFLTQLRVERDKTALDINYVYGKPDSEPLLLTACRRGDVDRITWLRQAGADFNARGRRPGNQTALLIAAEQVGEHPHVLAHLLGEPTADQAAEETSFIAPELNARNRADRTALHLLVQAAYDPATKQNAEAGLRRLAAVSAVDLDARNEDGHTPLRLALELGLWELVLALADAGADLPAELRPQLESDAHLQRLVARLGRPARPRPADQLLYEAVHQTQTEAAVKEALERLAADRPAAARRRVLDSPFGLYTYLQLAARRGRLELARLLLDAGASPDAASPLNPQPPLLYAAERGDVPLLKLLLNWRRTQTESLPLTEMRDPGQRGLNETALHRAARHGSDRCLDLLLTKVEDPEELVRWVNLTNSLGRTALHLALDNGSKKGALRLLAAGASLAVTDQTGAMPIDLIQPETLRAALDACVRPSTKKMRRLQTSAQKQQHRRQKEEELQRRLRAADCQMEVDFTCLAPPRRPQKSPEMPVLMRLRANPQMRGLLQHPVLAALLYLKYDRARWLYYCNVLLFVSSTALLTVFVFGLDGRAGLGGWATSAALRGLLTAGLALLTARELLQMLITGPLYFLSAENWVELAVLALGFPLVWLPLAPPTQKHLSAWIMVASWLEVAMSVGRTPTLAPYKTMMESIALSFGRLIFLYFGLVMAFAIAFYLVFSGVSSFATFGLSMPKVMAMATGEFDYGDLSETMTVDEAAGVTGGHVLSGVLLFVCFLFLIFIVLMNLLTSLAVEDTQAIWRQAAVMAADNRIVLLAYLENFLLLSYLPARLKRPAVTLRSAGEGACVGLKERVRRRVLLFHTALSAGRYQFRPNQRERPVTFLDVAHACGQRRWGDAAGLCCRWLTLDGCVGERHHQLPELPAELRQQLLQLVLPPQSLERRLERLQAEVGSLSRRLEEALTARQPAAA